MPIAGKRYFVFHESMYSALPTKLMRRGTVIIKNAESRNEMWFGHKMAPPLGGSRCKPSTPTFQRTLWIGPPMVRTMSCIFPAPASAMRESLRHQVPDIAEFTRTQQALHRPASDRRRAGRQRLTHRHPRPRRHRSRRSARGVSRSSSSASRTSSRAAEPGPAASAHAIRRAVARGMRSSSHSHESR